MARVRPQVSEMDGVASPSRAQAIQVAQNLTPYVEWVLRDDLGNPIDPGTFGLGGSSSSSAGPGGSVKLRVVECLSVTSQQVQVIEIEGEVVDPVEGLVRARLTSACTALPGVYILEWSVYDSAGELVHVTAGSMIVNRGLSGDRRFAGPPSVAEIRTHLRDSGPEDNYLLDTVEYDLAELAACIERPVQIWNETLEFVAVKYNTQTFPYRERWLSAIIGYLHVLAAHNYERNFQEYSAGGTSVRDKAKGQPYLQKGVMLLQEFREFVKVRKGQLNLDGCYGSTSECY